MKRPIRILWVSRHPPLPRQIEILRRKFCEVEIIQYAGWIKRAEDVIELMKIYKADEVVTILPLSIIHELAQRGVKPLFPAMRRAAPEEPADYVDPGSGSRYVFDRFKRVKAVIIEGDDLETEPTKCTP